MPEEKSPEIRTREFSPEEIEIINRKLAEGAQRIGHEVVKQLNYNVMQQTLKQLKLDPEPLRNLERRGGWNPFGRPAQKQAGLSEDEALKALAAAYDEGMAAGEEEEAERRIRAKYYEITSPK